VRILLDECVDWRLARNIADHDVKTTRQMGWTTIENGESLARASEQFDVFITVDRNLSFQQHLVSLPIAVIVLHARSEPARRSSAVGTSPAYSNAGGTARHRPHCCAPMRS
jgi:hypothetical protein